MIQVVIEMDETGQGLTIRTAALPLVALAIVTSAYHELLSAKVRNDLKAESRIIDVTPKRGRFFNGGQR
jgi:hypothetical protein